MAAQSPFTTKHVTNKARNIMTTRLGDITVGSAYFWFIILGLLANMFTLLITYVLKKAGVADIAASVVTLPKF